MPLPALAIQLTNIILFLVLAAPFYALASGTTTPIKCAVHLAEKPSANQLRELHGAREQVRADESTMLALFEQAIPGFSQSPRESLLALCSGLPQRELASARNRINRRMSSVTSPRDLLPTTLFLFNEIAESYDLGIDAGDVFTVEGMSFLLARLKALQPISFSPERFSELRKRARQLLGNAKAFINLKRGGVLALRELELFSSKTPASLKALYSHFPQEMRSALQKEIASLLSTRSGNIVLTPARYDRPTVGTALKYVTLLIVLCHNELHPDSLSVSDVDSKAGMQAILFQLTGRASLGISNLTEDFGRVEIGGVQALRDLAGFSGDPTSALFKLCDFFPESEKEQVRLWAKAQIRAKTVGAEALRGRSVYAARPILDVLYFIISLHNARHPEESPLFIPVDSLRDKDRLRAELPKLTGWKLRPEELEQFSDRDRGGLSALRELPGYTGDTMGALKVLLVHLPKKKQDALLARIQARLPNPNAIGIALGTKSKSRDLNAERLWDVVQWIAEEHNREVPIENRYHVHLEDLASQAGMADAVARIQRRISAMTPEGNTAFCDESNGLKAALQGVEGIQSMSGIFEQWISDFPAEHKRRLSRLFAARLGKKVDSRTTLNGNIELHLAVRDCLHWIAETHNRLLVQGDRNGFPANEDPRTSHEIGETLFAITRRISLRDRSLAAAFRKKETGGVNAIRDLRGYSRNLSQVLANLVPLEGDDADILKAKIASRLERPRIGSEIFLPGNHHALADRVMDALGYLILAHNEVAELRETETIDFDQLASREGTSAALTTLKR